jgi:peptide-methionine (S)-S-oxide reductase
MNNLSNNSFNNLLDTPTFTELATLGGGCFWCTEAIFQTVRGVLHVENGYANGHTLNPSYDDICTGQTGHAEVIQIRFDSAKISYEQLLHIFFNTHDATTLNRQGNDIGTQYRSTILTHSAAQAITAASVLATAQEHNPSAIVTKIEPLTNYYPAEAYHQNYYANHPFEGYCAAVITPKVAAFQQTLQRLLK